MTAAYFGLAVWAAITLVAIVAGRWSELNRQINRDVALLRAIPSTSPAPAQAASHAEVGTPSSGDHSPGPELGSGR
ncbi:hypothetical protein [Mycobacterium sp. NAZ190054]|uniref:hypothetical protein n=1 Tax=Mycobacterium sp. NAZ190054 TaxID=1747766 RepID=UPI0012E3817E|nr:hypothetical protein [Mycobacterium sp. NAZ190054]